MLIRTLVINLVTIMTAGSCLGGTVEIRGGTCDLSDALATKITTTIQAIDRLFAETAVALPGHTVIKIAEHGGGGFSAASGEILLPCAEDEGDMAVTLGHEYGHWIFETNLRRVLADRESLFARREQLEKAGPQGRAELRKIIDLIQLQQRVCTKYGELFADLLAVVFAEDGAAMMKNLFARSRGAPSQRARIRYVLRDFSEFHEVDWNAAPGFIRRDPHVVFHPSRVVIWKTFFSGAETPSDRGRRLATLLRSFLDQAVTGVADPVAHGNLSVNELNSLLLGPLH